MSTDEPGGAGRGGRWRAGKWRADALHGIGQRRAATELLERLMGQANDVGLLAEEYDQLGRQVGNTPQAFSHLGLVNAARHLSGARSAAPGLCQPRVSEERSGS